MSARLGEALAEYRSGLRGPQPDEGPRAHRLRWRRWSVGGLALLVAAGGVWAGVGSSPADSDQPAAEPTVVSSSPPTVESPASTAESNLTEPGQAAALVVSPVTRWRRWSTAALVTWLPEVDGAGPRQADPARLVGFAHSPQGALAAAGSLLPAIYYTRDEVAWRWLADERVMWAQGARSALEASLQPVWQVASGVTLRPVGFRMLSYSPQRAQVRLWWRTDRPAGEALVVGAIATVRWVSGDWWLVFDEPAMDLRALDPARDGYLAWGPTRDGAA